MTAPLWRFGARRHLPGFQVIARVILAKLSLVESNCEALHVISHWRPYAEESVPLPRRASRFGYRRKRSPYRQSVQQIVSRITDFGMSHGVDFKLELMRHDYRKRGIITTLSLHR